MSVFVIIVNILAVIFFASLAADSAQIAFFKWSDELRKYILENANEKSAVLVRSIAMILFLIEVSMALLFVEIIYRMLR